MLTDFKRNKDIVCYSRDQHIMQSSVSKTNLRRQPVSSRGKTGRREPKIQRQSIRGDAKLERRNSIKRSYKVSNIFCLLIVNVRKY